MYMWVNLEKNTKHSLRRLLKLHGSEVVKSGYLTRVIQIIPTKQYLLDIGFHEKAADKMLRHSINFHRPLHDYRKTDGKLTSEARKSSPQQRMFAHIDSEQKKLNGEFTNEQRKSLQTLSKLANKRSQYLQKMQIMTLARNARNLKFKNAITYEPLDPKNAYILPENYRMGSKQMYSLNTVKKLQQGNVVHYNDAEMRSMVIGLRNQLRQIARINGVDLGSLNHIDENFVRDFVQQAPKQLVSPYTRRNIKQAIPFKTQYNLDYDGKFNLLKSYLKDRDKTTKSIAKLYT
jgi:hypothetical protein